MKASKKTLIFFGIALGSTFIVSSIYVFLFISMKNKTAGTAELSGKIDDLTGRESRLVSSMAVLRREGQNIDKVTNFFFKESQVVEFTKKIEALGEQSGTKLTLESLDKGLTEKTIPYLNFRINASGNFDQTTRLIKLLENFPGKIEWKTLRLTREDMQTGEVKVPGYASTVPQWRVEAFLSALNFVNE